MARIPEQPPRGGEQRDHALIVGGRSTDPFRQCRALRRTPGVEQRLDRRFRRLGRGGREPQRRGRVRELTRSIA